MGDVPAIAGARSAAAAVPATAVPATAVPATAVPAAGTQSEPLASATPVTSAAGDASSASGGATTDASGGATTDGSTDDGRLEGTAAYLSPELIRGGRPSVASDAWAFGCTLYQSLCGKPPLWAETPAEVMQRIVKFEPDADQGILFLHPPHPFLPYVRAHSSHISP